MATVYKIELVSHWVNVSPDRLEKIIKEALKKEQVTAVEVKAERKA